MQRYKRYLIETYGTFQNPEGHTFLSPCPRTGKFVYGANGTLTQAALYRLTAVVNAARYPGDSVASYRKHLAGVRHMLVISRRGGCRLPS